MSDVEKVGRFQVLERIGVGSFTVVYRGLDTFSQRPVAIKICIAQDENLRTGFLRLAETAGRLRHPNIVSVLEFGSGDGKPYLVEEFVSGEHLGWKIEGDEPIPRARRIEYLSQIAQGLRYAHGEGVIHKHLSPRTVRIQDDGVAKITDFGIAQLATASSLLMHAKGTPETEGYLAPEQALGLRSDARTDVFAFGALAYHLLTYQRPFAGETLSEQLRKVLESDSPLPEGMEALSPGMARLVEQCLQRDPSDRYPGFDPILAELKEIARQEAAGDLTGQPGELSPEDTQAIPADVLAMHKQKGAGNLGAKASTAYILDPPPVGTPLPEPARTPPAEIPAQTVVMPPTVVVAPPAALPVPPPPPTQASAVSSLAPTVVMPLAAASAAAKPAPPAPPPPAQAAKPGPPATPAAQAAKPGPPAPAAPPKVRPGRKHLPRWQLAAGGVVVLAALGLVFALAFGPTAENPAEQPAPALAPSPPPPPVESAPDTGAVVVDARPWGEVQSVTDASGKSFPVRPPRFTPLFLSLPPGTYTIELAHPEAPQPVSCQVAVTRGGVARCTVELQRVDAAAYFRGVGWWP